MVYDHGLPVRRQVVSSEESFAEIGADLRRPLLDISRIRYLLDFVYHQAVTVSIESLALSQPENLVSFHNQPGVASAAGIDSNRIVPVWDPMSAER